MIKKRWILAAAFAAAALPTLAAPAAARGNPHMAPRPSAERPQTAPERSAPRPDTALPEPAQEGTREEVRGLRLIPAVMPHRVALAPSPWMMRAARGDADAIATIYTTRDGGTAGLTLKATGLPDPERLNPAFNHYVVWLRDSGTGEMRNIGTLDAHNGGTAVFGYQPEMPLRSYDTLVVTPEKAASAGRPAGWDFLTAALPGTVRAREDLAPEPSAPNPFGDGQGIDPNR